MKEKIPPLTTIWDVFTWAFPFGTKMMPSRVPLEALTWTPVEPQLPPLAKRRRPSSSKALEPAMFAEIWIDPVATMVRFARATFPPPGMPQTLVHS